MSRRTIWLLVFLGVFTAGALTMEIWASVDDSPDTVPWTDLIVEYIPMEFTAFAIGGLCLWLVVHFGLRYWHRKIRFRQGG